MAEKPPTVSWCGTPHCAIIVAENDQKSDPGLNKQQFGETPVCASFAIEESLTTISARGAIF
jgi:hypothetical protein